jgi:hypothetical protein
MIPLVGYGPDLDSTTPGVITNCSALVPGLKGMEGAPSPQATNLAALTAACKGGAVCRKLDNTVRFFAGTVTKLQEAGSTSWTDRTRASGGDYALASDGRWRFAQFADQSLAATKSDILQASTAGAFANAAANAPKAGIVLTGNGFIILLDVNDQGGIYDSTDRPHGWWIARSSATWTPSVANEAYTGELKSTPGKCRAGKMFGNTVIAYKDRSMYRGTYVGQAGWEFELIPGEAGAMSQEVVIDVGTAETPKHILMGFEDFYEFAGGFPQSIGTPLTKTVFGELNKQYSHVAMALHDRVNKRIYFFYPVASSANPDKCVVYNYWTKQWGRDDRSVEAVVEYITGGITYDDLGNYFATYNDLPEVSYDSPFWTSGFPNPAIFNTSHAVQTLDGAATSSSLTTGDYGTDDGVTLLSRVQPKFLTKPTSATMTNYYKDSLGGSLTTDQTVSMDSKGRFDVLRSSNWHRARFDFTGPVVLPALNAQIDPDGDE